MGTIITPVFAVLALQAVKEEIDNLRRDINQLKRVVAEKEQEMLSNGMESKAMHNTNNNTNNNSPNNNNYNNSPNSNYNKRMDEIVVYSL